MRANVEATARSNPGLAASPHQWDADPDLLGTPGGTVDLRTGELHEARRDEYITRLTSVTPAEVGTPAELWEQFLFRVMGNDIELVAFLQRLAGYALTGHTSEHKLPFLFGPGGNGKSVFMNTLRAVMADYATGAPAETFLATNHQRHPTELAGLQGARLVVGSELPAGRAWNESTIKDLTGGDPITARYMRQDYFTFLPQFTLMIYGNHQPSIGAVDEAMRRRILLIPFTARIAESEKDSRLQEKLEDEHPAILRWMIDGAVAWHCYGLAPPRSVIAASEEYLDAEDTLGQFLGEELVADRQAEVRASELYSRYRDWCEQQGTRPWSQKALSQALRERGYRIEHTRYGRALYGVRLARIGDKA
jgi:P4 family phage/plasmid primase-like protien